MPFPADSPWNMDISSAAVDPNSDNIIIFIGADVTLHPDFGSGTYAGQSIGIPYQVVAGSPPKVSIYVARFALGLLEYQLTRAADGHAKAAEGQLRHLGPMNRPARRP